MKWDLCVQFSRIKGMVAHTMRKTTSSDHTEPKKKRGHRYGLYDEDNKIALKRKDCSVEFLN